MGNMPQTGASASESETLKGKVHLVLDGIPPGIVLDRYAIDDLRSFADTGDERDIATRYVVVWTTLRDSLIDRWLDAERILRTACVLLISPAEQLQARVWDLIRRQSGQVLVDLTADLLEANGHPLPKDFRVVLRRLVELRNVLAHQPSRPRQYHSDEGLVFFESTGFRTGRYVQVRYEQIDNALADARPIMEWLTSEIPDADGFGVEFRDEIFDADRTTASD